VPRLFAALPVPGAFAREAAALSRKGIDASWSAPGRYRGVRFFDFPEYI
jgi:hypothetical protein